jgi:hypothetical protein
MRVASATADGVGADEAGDDRQQAHARLGRQLEEELAGRHRQGDGRMTGA